MYLVVYLLNLSLFSCFFSSYSEILKSSNILGTCIACIAITCISVHYNTKKIVYIRARIVNISG